MELGLDLNIVIFLLSY